METLTNPMTVDKGRGGGIKKFVQTCFESFIGHAVHDMLEFFL